MRQWLDLKRLWKAQGKRAVQSSRPQTRISSRDLDSFSSTSALMSTAMKDTSAKRRQNRRWNAFNASRKRTPERIQQGKAHHEPQQRARAVEKAVVHERKGWEGGAPNLRPRRIADRRSTTAAAALSKRAIDGRLIQRAL